MLTLVDWIVVALLAAFALLGTLRGIVRDLVLLVGIIAGAYLAWRFGARVNDWLLPMIRDKTASAFLSRAAVLAGVAAVFALVGELVARAASMTVLGWLDRLLGAAFGLAKGLVSVWCVIAAVLLVEPAGNEPVAATRIASRIMTAGNRLLRSGFPETRPRPREHDGGLVDSVRRLPQAVHVRKQVLDMRETGSTIMPKQDVRYLPKHCSRKTMTEAAGTQLAASVRAV